MLLHKLYDRNALSGEYKFFVITMLIFINELDIEDAPRYYAAIYLAICLSTFLLGILSAFCCRIVHDQHQDTYEQDELHVTKKRREVNKILYLPLLISPA